MPNDLKIASDICDIREQLQFRKDTANGGFVAARNGIYLQLNTIGGDVFILSLVADKQNKMLLEHGLPTGKPYTMSAERKPKGLDAEMKERLYRKIGELLDFADQQCKLAEQRPAGVKEKLGDILYRVFMNGEL